MLQFDLFLLNGSLSFLHDFADFLKAVFRVSCSDRE